MDGEWGDGVDWGIGGGVAAMEGIMALEGERVMDTDERGSGSPELSLEETQQQKLYSCRILRVYEPELHPGVTYKLYNPKATLKIFSTGGVTITARSVSDVQSAVERIYPLVYEFRKPRTPADEEQLRQQRAARVPAALRLAARTPHLADPLRLVTVSEDEGDPSASADHDPDDAWD
ncbi:TATA box-binding protein-like protein 1 [Eumeta japonica]|uniref:TATA box-binding protein-like protein 1 n=1 Tax=Eumeta variegata TaxID=151549 RepID=A0A4C1SXN5_EUMVA|nr:TATA box-binding protein-like protein 1 [Eumeta japonica]